MLHSRESSIREIIRHICINQEHLTYAYSPFLNHSDYIDLLNKLKNSSPPEIFKTTKAYINNIFYYYSINVLLNKENIFQNINLQSYYLCELKKCNKFWSNELYQALSNETIQLSIRNLSFNLTRLLDKKRPLFRCLQSQFWKILHQYSNSDLIKFFGLTIFEMDDQIDLSLLNSLDLIKNINSLNISTFFQIPSVLLTGQSSKLIQSLISCSEPFPGCSKLFKETNIITLINDSIMKKYHFFENILKVGISYNCNISKLTDLTKSCCCSEILPFYFILNDGEINEQPIDELSKLDDSKICNIFKRIYGDRLMSDLLRKSLGTIIPIERLNEVSFVSLLRPVLFDFTILNPIIDLSSNVFYSLNDHDRNSDFDFYFGLRLIYLILTNNYTYKTRDTRKDYYHNYQKIREINHILSRIRNKDVLIEVFSAIFACDKQTGKFYCQFDVAEAIIKFLTKAFPLNPNESTEGINTFNDKALAELFANASMHIQLGKLLLTSKNRKKFDSSPSKNTLLSLKPCFLTPTDVVATLLSRGEFDKANEAASSLTATNLSSLSQICEVARSIQTTTKFSYSSILSEQSRRTFNIEYCLTTNDDTDYILCHYVDKTEEYLYTILNNRKNQSQKDLLKPIQSFSISPENCFDAGELNENDAPHLKHFVDLLKKFDEYGIQGHLETMEVEQLIDTVIEKVNTYDTFVSVLGEQGFVSSLPLFDKLKEKVKFINLANQFSETLSTCLQVQNCQSIDSCKILNNYVLAQKTDFVTAHNQNDKKKKSIFTISKNHGKEMTHIKGIEIDKIPLHSNENIFNIKIHDPDELSGLRNQILSILNNQKEDKIDALIDLKLMTDDSLFYGLIGLIMDHLPFQEFLNVFPEFATSEFETIQTEKSTPVFILTELITKEKVSIAINYSVTFKCKDLLITKLAEKVENLRQIDENMVTVFFNVWNQLSADIFKRLPPQLYMNLNSQIELLRNDNTPVDDVHPELPVLKQYPYLNFDNDLLSIFDKKIAKPIDSQFLNDLYENGEHKSFPQNAYKQIYEHYYDYYLYFVGCIHNPLFEVIEEYVNVYLTFFKKKDIIIDKIGQTLFGIVNSIVINSMITERVALKKLEKILIILKNLKLLLYSKTHEMVKFPFDREIKLIECIHEFCELYVYSRYNIEYSYCNLLNQNDKPVQIFFFVQICHMFDFPELIEKFANLWEFDISEFKLLRIENCYQLNQFDATISLLKNLAPSKSLNQASIRLTLEQKERLRNRFLKAVFFDVGDAVRNDFITKIQNYNVDNDINMDIEIEEISKIRNNYNRINELMKRRRSDLIKKNSSSSTLNPTLISASSNNIKKSQSMVVIQKKKPYVALLSNDELIQTSDLIEISHMSYSQTGYYVFYSCPFYDENVFNTFVENLYGPIEKISYHSMKGNFAESFHIYFTELPRQKRIVQVVLIEIFLAALNSFRYDELFWYLNLKKFNEPPISTQKTMNSADSYDFKKLLFNDIPFLLTKMKMKKGLYDFLNRLSQYELMIVKMIDMIDNEVSWEESLDDLNSIIETIQKELTRRTSPDFHSKIIFTNDELTSLLSKAGVQNTFTRLCMDNKIPFPSNNSDATSEIHKISLLMPNNNRQLYMAFLSNIEEMAVIALYYEKFNLALQILELSKAKLQRPINSNSFDSLYSSKRLMYKEDKSFIVDDMSYLLFKVCNRLVMKFNMNHRPISSYFQIMENRLDQKAYELLAINLSKVISGFAVSSRDVPVFVTANVKGPKLQGTILIELGFLLDAMKIAVKIHDIELIKKIEKQARIAGNQALQSKCEQYLQLGV